MAVNFVDLEVLPSASVVTPVLPVLVPVVVEAPVASLPAEPPRTVATLDHSPSYWVRRRRQQELLARALIDETSG